MIERESYGFFLDSSLNNLNLGNYSFISWDPFLILRSKGKEENPFPSLKNLLNLYSIDSDLPFPGGVVGYFGYDLGRLLEDLPNQAKDDIKIPDLYLGFYDTAIILDHNENFTYLISTGLPERGKKGERRARERMKLLEKRLSTLEKRVGGCEVKFSPYNFKDDGENLESNFSKDKYLEAVEKAKEYISAGDIYQVNLSQRFKKKLHLSPSQIYLRLRQINPAPFAGYLKFEDLTVISGSPERFLKFKDGVVETRPMKGTRPRGLNQKDDSRLKNELINSEKDKAELVMITDLERNDLGKVCEYGSVRVEELRTLETYATVFQTTSKVVGKLRSDKDRVDLISSSFPGGSITGAPKIRAMEVIEELEPTKRGIYTGSIGYLSFNNRMDLNIVIRTFLVKGNNIYFQVGGGIVADSIPEAEYQETLDKAKALFGALGINAYGVGNIS